MRGAADVAGFDVVRKTSMTASEAWQRVTDWQRHGDFVPLTKISVGTDPESGLVTFTARTAVGPIGFDDPMTITHSQPPTDTEPGVARIVKRGRVVLGWAVLTVTPLESGCEVRWHEEARLIGTRGPLVSLVDRLVAGGFGRLLDGLLAT